MKNFLVGMKDFLTILLISLRALAIFSVLYVIIGVVLAWLTAGSQYDWMRGVE